jgi:hypothetical protein
MGVVVRGTEKVGPARRVASEDGLAAVVVIAYAVN